MAIYHLSAKAISRSKGRSATGAAAYRAAERIVDERTGIVHDYERKKGVDFCKIIGWNGTRSELWNAAEAAEKRKDSVVAREYEVALPTELSNIEKTKLAIGFAMWLNQQHGVAVDLAIHGINTKNPHAHLLTSTRVVEDNGFRLGDKAAREWSGTKRKQNGLGESKDDLIEAREAWEQFANVMLERSGSDARIDRRSLEDQGIDRIPGVHLGPTNNHFMKRGILNSKIEQSNDIQSANDEIKNLVELDDKLQEIPMSTFEIFAEKTGETLDEIERKIKKERLQEAELRRKIEAVEKLADEMKTEQRKIKSERTELIQQRDELNPLQVIEENKINKIIKTIEKRFSKIGKELKNIVERVIPELNDMLDAAQKKIRKMGRQFDRINAAFNFAVKTLDGRGYWKQPETADITSEIFIKPKPENIDFVRNLAEQNKKEIEPSLP